MATSSSRQQSISKQSSLRMNRVGNSLDTTELEVFLSCFVLYIYISHDPPRHPVLPVYSRRGVSIGIWHLLRKRSLHSLVILQLVRFRVPVRTLYYYCFVEVPHAKERYNFGRSGFYWIRDLWGVLSRESNIKLRTAHWRCNSSTVRKLFTMLSIRISAVSIAFPRKRFAFCSNLELISRRSLAQAKLCPGKESMRSEGRRLQSCQFYASAASLQERSYVCLPQCAEQAPRSLSAPTPVLLDLLQNDKAPPPSLCKDLQNEIGIVRNSPYDCNGNSNDNNCINVRVGVRVDNPSTGILPRFSPFYPALVHWSFPLPVPARHLGISRVAYFSTEPAKKSEQDRTSQQPKQSEETKLQQQQHQHQSTGVENPLGSTTRNKTIPSRKLGTTPVPTPPSAPPAETNPLQRLKGTTPKTFIRKGVDLVVSASKSMVSFLIKLPGNALFYATHPTETRNAWYRLRDMAKAEIHHYWVGTKLLWADIQTARKLLNKTLEGSSLTRRERKQMLRTVSDLFRLIPFSMFVLVPFMEFALPLALRLFPNMLPSTYQDSLKNEENMKRELKSRIAMAQFFQEYERILRWRVMYYLLSCSRIYLIMVHFIVCYYYVQNTGGTGQRAKTKGVEAKERIGGSRCGPGKRGRYHH